MTDIPSNQPYTKALHPSLQFLSFIFIVIGTVVLGNIIGAGIVMAAFGMDTLMDIARLNISSLQAQNALWIIQLVGTTLPLLLSPVFFAYVIVRDPDDYLKTSFQFSWLLIVVVFCLMMAANPLIEILSNINQKMVLPPFLKGIEKWMKDSEDSAQKISEAMMQMKTVSKLIFDLFIIGFLTAIVEEFTFRGCLQTIFVRWTNNYHVAIWITAILFSAFHMEFYGFLPRLLLGALFGYFCAWSGSVWPAVWAHFVNNGTAVIITYLSQHKLVSINADDQHVFNNAGYVISLIITLFLLFIYRYISNHNMQSLETDGEELD